jgi:L-alanine-DL-glutamate epimerase-like enolase superfamily enzyme
MTGAVAGRLAVRIERWPLARPFTIARGSKTEAVVVVAEIATPAGVGRGEAVPYARYGESVEAVAAAAQAMAPMVAAGLDRRALLDHLPAGAARNAIDCALVDAGCRLSGVRAWQRLGFPPPATLVTAETIALDAIGRMQAAAAALAGRPLLKVKVGADAVVDRVAAVRAAAPRARLIVDANEAWSARLLADVLPALADLGVVMIEQPLPAGSDADLAGFPSPIPLCADESCHTVADLDALPDGYQMVNVKLDKAGGLLAAADLMRRARDRGLAVMVGCMVATSLAMAPALLLAGQADLVDLDGPLWLAADRLPGLAFADGLIAPPPPGLWG